MPGFVGICSKALAGSDQSVQEAVRATVYSTNTVIKDLHHDTFFHLKKSVMTFLEKPRMHAQQDQVQVWVDGEILNQDELRQRENESFSETIVRHYRDGTLEDLLRKVNGIYIALIYDLQKEQVHLVTDRYGMKPFYIYVRNNCFIFAPELKCFTPFRSFEMKIRKDVVDCFLDLGHFMSTATWFDGVDSAAPSMVYTYSWATDTLIAKRYWSWSLIKPSKISFCDAVEQLGTLLDTAIKSCGEGSARIGLGLSGGFDSRAILAALEEMKPPVYTFGIEGSSDVKIARKVAAVAGVKHTYFDMQVEDWLPQRFKGVWKTDGMLNMYHMHYSHVMDKITTLMDINVSGFLGDALLGHSYLNKKGKKFLNQRITRDIAQHYCGKHYAFCDPDDPYFDLDKVDIYMVYNRGRRFVGMGMEEPNKTIYQRLPFMDTRVLDFSHSLPDEFRDENRLYHQALLLTYPKFYKTVPHSVTGVPIRVHPSLLDKGTKLYHRLVWIAKYKLGMKFSYTDVNNWIKEPETAAFIRDVLNPKHALYAQFTSMDFLTQFVDPHVQGKRNFMKEVMSALTMEIWLQQLLNKKYLNA